jgi:hypothetical protein
VWPEPLLCCQLRGVRKRRFAAELLSCALASSNPSNLGRTKVAISTAPKQAPALKSHSPVSMSNCVIVECRPNLAFGSRRRFVLVHS